MKKLGVLCGGFGGVEIGATQAGIKPIWSIEIDPAIAEVAQSNLHHKIIVSDILDVDPHTMEAVYILHTSPPCRFFSLGNANRGETEQDIAMARKTAEFVKVLKPHIFTLENVWMYRKSQSWQIIRNALYEADYWLDIAHVNSADFGVPQTRKRMIVRAIRGSMLPYLPQPEPWCGWYDAIEDLIPDLPESQFAPWQLARLPDELKTVIIPGDNTSNGTIRHDNEPMVTIQTRDIKQCPHRAFIVGQNYGSPNDNGKGRKLNIRQSHRPIFTIETNANRLCTRAWLSQGRIVSMTPRCLARFQTIPYWYILPEKNKLACKGIGNLLPPLWYEKIIGGLIVN